MVIFSPILPAMVLVRTHFVCCLLLMLQWPEPFHTGMSSLKRETGREMGFCKRIGELGGRHLSYSNTLALRLRMLPAEASF